MRKVTDIVVGAFLNKQEKKIGNTSTDGETLYLHGNPIAWHEKNVGNHDLEGFCIEACGWLTNTTKERLNAIPGVSISQRKGLWYLNGQQWDGQPTFIPILPPQSYHGTCGEDGDYSINSFKP
jgi:hypothetical protein